MTNTTYAVASDYFIWAAIIVLALAMVAMLGVAAGIAFWWGSRSYGRDRARAGFTFPSPPPTGPETAVGRPAPPRGPRAER